MSFWRDRRRSWCWLGRRMMSPSSASPPFFLATHMLSACSSLPLKRGVEFLFTTVDGIRVDWLNGLGGVPRAWFSSCRLHVRLYYREGQKRAKCIPSGNRPERLAGLPSSQTAFARRGTTDAVGGGRERGPLWAVHLSRRKWPGGLVNQGGAPEDVTCFSSFSSTFLFCHTQIAIIFLSTTAEKGQISLLTYRNRCTFLGVTTRFESRRLGGRCSPFPSRCF